MEHSENKFQPFITFEFYSQVFFDRNIIMISNNKIRG